MASFKNLNTLLARTTTTTCLQISNLKIIPRVLPGETHISMNPVDHQEIQIGDFVIFIKNPNPAVILLGPNSSGQPPLPDSSSPPQSQYAAAAVSPILKMKSMSDIGGTIYDRVVQLVNTVGFGKSLKREGLVNTMKHVWKGSDYFNSEKPSLESLNVKIDNVQASMVKLQNNNQTKFGEIMTILQKIEASSPHSPLTPSPTPTPRAPIPPLLQKVNEIRGKPAEKGNGKSKPEKENGNKQGNENGKNGNKQENENGKNGGNNKQGNKEDEKNGGNNKEDEKNGGNKEAENVNQESATATKPDDDETDDDEAAASSVIIRVPKREVNESIPQYGFKVAKVVLGKVVWFLIRGGGGE